MTPRCCRHRVPRPGLVLLGLVALGCAGSSGAQVLGAAQRFNIFALEEADLRYVLVHGRVAAGASALLWRASIGDDASQVAAGADAVVIAGVADLLDCDIAHGNLRTGSAARLVRTHFGDGAHLPGVPVDFAAARSHLAAASAHWATLPQTGTRAFSGGSLAYLGDHPRLNVLRLRAEDLVDATSFVLEAPAGSTLLVDYAVTTPWLRNLRITVRGLDGSRVLHNFSTATTLGLEGAAIIGAVVAPGAVITLTGSSTFEGPLIGRAVGGPQTPTFLTGTRFVPFAGELPLPTATPPAPGGCAQGGASTGASLALSAGMLVALLFLLFLRLVRARSRPRGDAARWHGAASLVALGLLAGSLASTASPASAQALGAAAPFDLFVLGDAALRESSSEGRIAIGGHGLLFNYVVGAGLSLPLDRARDDLVVGGVLHFVQGVVARGRARSGGHAALFEVGASSESGAPPAFYAEGNPLDFAAARRYLEGASAFWAALPPTGTTQVEDTLVYRDGQVADVALTLTLRGREAGLNVFSVADHELALASLIDLDVPVGATALINVSGDYGELREVGLRHPETLRAEKILFHFPEAQVLQLSGVTLLGSVLAPRAALRAFIGHLYGQLVVGEVLPGVREDTTVETLPSVGLHHAPFDGSLPPPTAACAAAGGTLRLPWLAVALVLAALALRRRRSRQLTQSPQNV